MTPKNVVDETRSISAELILKLIGCASVTFLVFLSQIFIVLLAVCLIICIEQQSRRTTLNVGGDQF